MNGRFGLAGWQWLFVLEKLPAVILAFVTFAILPDRPEHAWLTGDERAVLAETMQRDLQQRSDRHLTLGAALINPRVLLLCLIYFFNPVCAYTLSFWMPTIVKNFGLSNTAVGFVSTIPYLVGVVVMFVWSSHSDKRTERLWHLTIAYLLMAAGLTISAFATAPVVSMLGLTISVSGYLASVPVFWTIPSGFLASTAAAGAIAMINSIGNLGGFFGPVLVGQITKSTGSLPVGCSVSRSSFCLRRFLFYSFTNCSRVARSSQRRLSLQISHALCIYTLIALDSS